MKANDSNTESERLRAYYASLPEGELVHLGSQYDTLTEAAQRVLRAEFARRHMAAPELATEEDPPEFQQLITIRSYRDLSEAITAKSAIESANIFATLLDEHTVRMNWFWSNTIGGIRLAVREEDEVVALEVLAQSDSSTTRDQQYP